MTVVIKNSNELIDDFFLRLEEYNVLSEKNLEKMDFSLAQDYLSGQISKFREWGNKLGLMNIFTFENNQVQATPLVNSIVNLRSMIRTSVFRTESYELVEKNQETGEEKAIIYHDLAIKSPNVQNSIENQILELLDIQQIFLEPISYRACCS